MTQKFRTALPARIASSCRTLLFPVCLLACAAWFAPTAHAQRRNLGDSINTEWNEIIPIISADGKTLYIDRKNYPLNTGSEADYDDIWYSEWVNDTTWSQARNLTALNSKTPNAIFSVLPDNNTALYWGAIDSAGKSVFSMVQRTTDGWSKPQPLRIREFYNHASGVTASLGPDGKTLLMGLRRDDSPGEMNIYVSFLEDEESNTWSPPHNLGTKINTRFGETSPVLGADNVTLFFTSGRPGGVGEMDVFMARRLDTTWSSWSDPVDLGAEFNIPGANFLSSITASGEYAFLSGTSDSPNKNMDIFRVEVPQRLRLRPVVLMKGRVLRGALKGSKEPPRPVAARVVYERLRDGAQLGIANTNPETGEFQIAFPGGEEYGLRVQSDSCLPVSDNLNYTTLDKYTEISREYVLPPIAVGSTMRLNNIFFEFAKADLSPSSYAELNRLGFVMTKNPTVTVLIEGHTDDVGTEEFNNTLSVARAEAVKTYLVSKHIAPERISVQGFGKHQPVAPNGTEEGRSKNRRVVFRITSK